MSATMTPDQENSYVEGFGYGATRIADMSAQHAARLYAGWLSGAFTFTGWKDRFLRALLTVDRNGYGMGDALAATVIELITGRRARPRGTGLVTVELQQRLTDAVDTLAATVDTADDPRPQIERLARSEPRTAFQNGVLSGLSAQGVTGYRRGLDADPCELCQWLFKDGYVYPTGKPMYHHPGCECVPVPVFDK